ncbi:MAG: hypothetical protein IPG17_22190 [Sandaracinaceae bacterium]|nr:hypothetical protein [Sandaracinaceae bacterium]
MRHAAEAKLTERAVGDLGPCTADIDAVAEGIPRGRGADPTRTHVDGVFEVFLGTDRDAVGRAAEGHVVEHVDGHVHAHVVGQRQGGLEANAHVGAADAVTSAAGRRPFTAVPNDAGLAAPRHPQRERPVVPVVQEEVVHQLAAHAQVAVQAQHALRRGPCRTRGIAAGSGAVEQRLVVARGRLVQGIALGGRAGSFLIERTRVQLLLLVELLFVEFFLVDGGLLLLLPLLLFLVPLFFVFQLLLVLEVVSGVRQARGRGALRQAHAGRGGDERESSDDGQQGMASHRVPARSMLTPSRSIPGPIG